MRLRFIEPHGMHHDGLVGNADRSAALQELEEVSRTAPFTEASVDMAGWIVTETPQPQIPGAESLTYADLRNRHRVLHVAENYVETLLTS